MALGKGIPVINGFDLNSKLPLDSRTVADTMENMNKLVTDGSVGDGQLCYCKVDKKLYVLKEGAWSEVGGEGKGLNILSLNLKNCMNESDYNELVGYILQRTVIAKVYNITLPDLTGVDIVKFAVETPVGNISTTFYRNSKTMSQFNWLCNWANNENFMQMVTITGDTDNNVKYIKYNGIDSGGGKSVPPTLNLIDFETGEVRTSITQEEKDNLEKGLYNQVFYPEGGFEGCFIPSKMFSDKSSGFNIFAQFYVDRNAGSITSLTLYNLSIGEKDTSGNYPITIENQDGVPVGSGGASIPTLETKRSYMDANDTIYSDADIELIKKQENNFINLPIGDGNNVVNTLCFVVKNKIDSSGNSYILTAIGGWAVTLISSMSSAPVFIAWNANMTTKKLTTNQFTGLSYDNTSLYVQDNKIFLTDTFTTEDPVNILHTYYVFDTINGKPIIHSDTAVNNYNIPTITFEN